MAIPDPLKRRETETSKETGESSSECPHTTLTPGWKHPIEMGKADKVSRYRCDACGASFSAEEGQQLIAEEGHQLTAEEGQQLTAEEAQRVAENERRSFEARARRRESDTVG